MKILGLPGRDEATVAWLGEVLSGLTLSGNDHTIQRYGCWDDGGEFDLDLEVNKTGACAAEFVVAKSMGTRVALHAERRGVLRAQAYVLIGVPLKVYDDDERSALDALCAERRVLLIQQTDDFLGGFAELKEQLAPGPDAQLLEVPGSDHVYSDVTELQRLINAWCA